MWGRFCLGVEGVIVLDERGRDCMREAGFVPGAVESSGMSFFDRERDRDLVRNSYSYVGLVTAENRWRERTLSGPDGRILK